MSLQTEEAEAAYEQLDAARLHLRDPRTQVAAAAVFALLDLARSFRDIAEQFQRYNDVQAQRPPSPR